MGKEKDKLKLMATEPVPDRASITASVSSTEKQEDGLQLAPGGSAQNESLQLAAPDQERGDSTVEFIEDMGGGEAPNIGVVGEDVDGGATTGLLVENVDEEAPAASEAFEAFVPGQDRATNQPRARRPENLVLLVEGGNVKADPEESARRRYQLYALACILIAALIVGVSVAVTQSNKPTSHKEQEPTSAPSIAPSMVPSSSPSSSPTFTPTAASFQVVANDLELDFGPNTMLALQNFSSPQSRAARWMIDEDETFTFPLNETDPESRLRRRFRQRYALATLYFSTGGDTSWSNQASFLNPSLDECDWGNEALVLCLVECEIYHALFILLNHTNTRPCDDELPVPSVFDMDQINLVGRIPPEIGALTGMLSIGMSANSLTGSLPEEFYDLRNLLVLDLSFNQLTGSLSGVGMSKLAQMSILAILDNQMTGTLPSEISLMTRLELLGLSYNFFSGTIPAEWPQSLSALKVFSLMGCILTGELPSFLEQMTQLEVIFVSNNYGLNGTLPTELASIPTLRDLKLNNNQFSGTFPTEYASSSSITVIQVENNRLTGTIPTVPWLGSQKLTFLFLSGNKFTGTIPSEIGSLRGLRRFIIGNSGLTGTIPTELGNIGSTLVNLHIVKSPDLQGTIPTELGMLQNLTHFILQSNDLSGSIPSEVATPNLIHFSVWNNSRLTGSLPDSFGEISPQVIWLEDTGMNGNTSVICARYQPAELTADCDKVYCPCCSECLVNGTYLQAFEVYGV